MASELTGKGGVLLSTQPAGRRDRRVALTMLLVSIVIFVAAAPFAKIPLAPVSAFIPMYEAALVVFDLITAVLLLGQFSSLQSRALLALASGYLFDAYMAVFHALTFPGLFAPSGLLGAGPQSTAWLYMFWHAGFPLFVIAYALLSRGKEDARQAPRKVTVTVLTSGAAVLAGAGALTLLATAGQDALPSIMQGNHYTPLMIIVVSSVWLVSLFALALLWWRRPHSFLDLWLIVVMSAWLYDIALSAVLNAGRFDLGFYAGRIYGLLAASIVLMALLIESGLLYARLATANLAFEAVNKELEAFAYSVSHDLRAPIRGMAGFSQILIEDFGPQLPEEAQEHLRVIQAEGQRMGQLIDDMLSLSRVTRTEMKREPVNLSALATEVLAALRRATPERKAECTVADGLTATGDVRMLRILLDNLLGNAWKFTGRTTEPRIEFGKASHDGKQAFFVRDNGAGFDMAYADKLFGAFQRLHRSDEFPGTGIGLAIVQRIVNRHGGRAWAESVKGQGATFYFSL